MQRVCGIAGIAGSRKNWNLRRILSFPCFSLSGISHGSFVRTGVKRFSSLSRLISSGRSLLGGRKKRVSSNYDICVLCNEISPALEAFQPDPVLA